MKRKKLHSSDLIDKIYEYENGHFSIKNIVFLVITIFLIGFAINFPLHETIANYCLNKISSNKNCPISVHDIKTSFLFPSITFNKVIISNRCIKQLSNLEIDKIELSSFFPSIYPFGIKLKANIYTKKSKITAYPIISFNTIILKIAESKIHYDDLKIFFDNNEYINAIFEITSLITLKNSIPTEAQIVVKSKNLTIISQEYSGLEIPHMALGNFLIKATYENSKIDIHATFKGLIKLNKNIIAQSKIDMSGDIKFSSYFINEFSIINFYLNNKKSINGSYQFDINGTLAKPTFN